MFNSNIAPIKVLIDIRLLNLGDIDFDLSRSLKVKCDSAIDCPYMVSYSWLIVTYCLTRLFCKI